MPRWVLDRDRVRDVVTGGAHFAALEQNGVVSPMDGSLQVCVLTRQITLENRAQVGILVPVLWLMPQGTEAFRLLQRFERNSVGASADAEAECFTSSVGHQAELRALDGQR